MSLSRYLLSMLATTLLCWLAWYTVMISTNPDEAGMVGIALFYLTTTLALMGTFAVIGFFVRTVFLKQTTSLSRVIISFRQGIFFALLMDGFLFLQSMRLLTWYNIAFLIFAVTLAEFFVITRKTT